VIALGWLDGGNEPVRDGPVGTIAETAAPGVPAASPQPGDAVILDPSLEAVDRLIQSDIDSGFPGAVLLVCRGGETLFRKAYGNLKIYDQHNLLETPVPMRTGTVFDLASLTKVYATAFAAMKLADRGLLSVDGYVYEYLPEFDKDVYDQITIRQLLNHTSGYPSDVQFFRPDVLQGAQFYSTNRNITMELLADVPLETAPGAEQVYSDVGYMVLGAVIEHAAGVRLDQFLNEAIYGPLGLSGRIGFNPLENGFDKNNIACTERLGNTRDNRVDFPGIRNITLQGEVHDEKAYYSMGGVSGHAGLFADAEAVNILNQVLINGGAYEGTGVLSAQSIEQFTTIYDDLTYQLGFASAAAIRPLQGCVPEGALCHTGWTGTFSLIDRQNKLSVVLLTNKRHSVITDGKFEGELYETGKYYKVVTTIYESLGLAGSSGFP